MPNNENTISFQLKKLFIIFFFQFTVIFFLLKFMIYTRNELNNNNNDIINRLLVNRFKCFSHIADKNIIYNFMSLK